METFATIFERAAGRHGGAEALHEKITAHHPDYNPGPMALTNAQWLSRFTKSIFQAGFNWKVVEHKWDGFEEAFWNFNIDRCAQIDMDDLEKLTSDTRIIRNGVKIKSVPVNAQMIQGMCEQAGSADAFIRERAGLNYNELLEYLKKHGSRLGPGTASYALRFAGVPSYILSKDVTAALIFAGVIDKAPTSKSARRAVQAAFEQWSEEAGQDLSYVSKVLAHSVTVG